MYLRLWGLFHDQVNHLLSGYFAALEFLTLAQVQLDIDIVVFLSKDGIAFVIVLNLVDQVADAFLSVPYADEEAKDFLNLVET